MDEKTLLEKIDVLEQKIAVLEQANKNGIFKNLLRSRRVILFAVISTLLTATIAFAATIPNSFIAGDPISASKFNDNFSYIISRLWDLSGTDLYYNSGNVGIGTTSPGKKLEVAGTIQAQQLHVFSEDDYPTSAVYGAGDTSQSHPSFQILRARGTLDSPTKVLTNDWLGFLGAWGWDGTDFSDPSAYITFIASEDFDTSGHGTSMHFFTTPVGSTTVSSRLSITNDGNVGIGTPSPSSKLAVSGLPSGANDAVASGTLAGAVCITDSGDMYIDTGGSCVN